ncbi:MAG: AcrR family transcriptional regulator [Candidatus Aldehydirespiratoraceae bacterium]|jgi:AcrR family transcriptional regulator
MALTSDPTSDAGASKGEQTRGAILHAAIGRFGRDGFRATSVADIARDADISGTLAYNYFDNKRGLFLAALDDDIATLIDTGVRSLLDTVGDDSWRTSLLATLLAALEHHPLARRMLAGLEPAESGRIFDLPAMADLRQAVGDRLRADQAIGSVRADIDATPIGNGIVSIFVSLMLAAVQFGIENGEENAADVLSVVAAALDPPA